MENGQPSKTHNSLPRGIAIDTFSSRKPLRLRPQQGIAHLLRCCICCLGGRPYLAVLVGLQAFSSYRRISPPDVHGQSLQVLQADRPASALCNPVYRRLLLARVWVFQLSIQRSQPNHLHSEPGLDIYLPVSSSPLEIMSNGP